jgi:uncharacterized protein YgiB involved in biofilm formation
MGGKYGLAVLLGGVALLAIASYIDNRSRGGGEAQVSEQRIKIYPSVEACRAEQSADACDKAFAGAQREHEATAPHYATRESCEERYGAAACVPRGEGSGGWFIPAMFGFMLGNALSGPSYASTPVYLDRSGNAFAGNDLVGRYRRDCDPARTNCGSGGGSSYVYHGGGSGGSGSVWSNSAYRAETVTRPVTRGGFGSSASVSASSPSSAPSGLSSSPATTSGPVVRGGFGSTATAMAGHGGGGSE